MVLADTLTSTTFFSQASFEPAPTIGLLVAAGWYLVSVRRLRVRGRAWPITRTISFLFALLLLAVAMLSGIAAYDDTHFTIHATQHILIGMVAPIFLALSAPVTLALQASGRKTQTAILRVIHSRPARVLANPLVTWAIYGVSLFVLYFTGLYAFSLRHNVVHQLIHVHFLAVGCLFFWPVVGIDPMPRRLTPGFKFLYLMMTLPFHTILGMALQSQTKPIAPGVSISDLHSGGGLMWTAGEMIGLVATLAVLVQWLRADERAAKRHDRQTDAAAAAQLAHWRATREATTRAAARIRT
jgi:putative copper resistance protein D